MITKMPAKEAKLIMMPLGTTDHFKHLPEEIHFGVIHIKTIAFLSDMHELLIFPAVHAFR